MEGKKKTVLAVSCHHWKRVCPVAFTQNQATCTVQVRLQFSFSTTRSFFHFNKHLKQKEARNLISEKQCKKALHDFVSPLNGGFFLRNIAENKIKTFAQQMFKKKRK